MFLIYILFLFSILLGAIAQIMFKIGVSSVTKIGLCPYIINFHIIGGFALYGISFVIWIWALKFIDISVAYPSVSLSFIIVMIAGRYLFGEEINLMKIIAMLMIIL